MDSVGAAHRASRVRQLFTAGALDRSERKLIDSTHFHASVGVAPYRWPAWSDSLIDVLRATKLFDVVEPLEKIKNPDLIVYVRETANHANPLPFLPAITLGIIPIIDDDEEGEIFSIHSRHDPFVPRDYEPLPPPNLEKDEVGIEFRYTGTVHIGWIALLTGLVPGRSWFVPPWTRRYRDNLSLHICKRR